MLHGPAIITTQITTLRINYLMMISVPIVLYRQEASVCDQSQVSIPVVYILLLQSLAINNFRQVGTFCSVQRFCKTSRNVQLTLSEEQYDCT